MSTGNAWQTVMRGEWEVGGVTLAVPGLLSAAWRVSNFRWSSSCCCASDFFHAYLREAPEAEPRERIYTVGEWSQWRKTRD